MRGCIAVINAGSSSIKFALFEQSAAPKLLFRGQVEQIGISPHLHVANAEGEALVEHAWPGQDIDHAAATREIITTASGLLRGAPVAAVGHRVVHGGTDYAAPVRVTQTVIDALRKLTPLAPLHQPHNLAPIVAIAEAAPHIPQVACFDTGFHRDQPPLAQAFALPRKLTAEGIRRYGFHGLSYEFVTSRLLELTPELAERRLIVAHLGNGASLCAVHHGKSVATTMGFTAADGLMMGTRCGALDPGVLIYLLDTHRIDARGLESLIYKKSGLLGVSGISSDMRTLRESTEPSAAEAISLFVYRVVREIGSLAAALGGLDGLVFTGGIGEHDAKTRAEICAGCKWLGIELSDARNARGAHVVSAGASRVTVWVVPTDEERMIARHTSALLGLGAGTEQRHEKRQARR